jgi:hypothetical protein
MVKRNLSTIISTFRVREKWATLNIDFESYETAVINHQLTQHITQQSNFHCHRKTQTHFKVAYRGKDQEAWFRVDLDQEKRLSELHLKTATWVTNGIDYFQSCGINFLKVMELASWN